MADLSGVQIVTNVRVTGAASTGVEDNYVEVKAASTAAAAADPSLVVAHSPNSPTPAGTNTIGSVKLTDGTNIAAVKAASTQPASADTSQVVSISPNSIAVTDRATITAGTQQAAMMAGIDNGVARLARIGEFGTQRVTSEVMLWHDAIEGTTVNTFWTQSTTTMTIAQTTGVLTLNNAGITTLNTDAIITSQRQYPKYARNPLYCRFRANISANVASNHTLVEMGLGAPSGVTAVVPTGAFFRWTAAGALNGVLSFGSTEQSTLLLAQGTISTTKYYFYDIIADDDYVRFVVTDSGGVPVVDTQIALTNTVAGLFSASHQASFARVYVDATGGGTVIKLNISGHSVQILDGLLTKPWEHQMASCMRNGTINPTTYAQTGSAMTAAPSTETPSNTVGGYNTLGGEYAIALTASSENPLSVFGFNIPSPYTFYLRSIMFSLPFVTTAISTGTAPILEWLAVANCASGNISTGNGQRFPLGINFLYTSATQAAGTFLTAGGSLIWTPRVPIACLPGTFLHLGYKVFLSTITTAGVTRGTVYVDGYFE